jgi:hypothetical protein
MPAEEIWWGPALGFLAIPEVSMKRRHVILGALSALALTIGGVAPFAVADNGTHSGIQHFLLLQTGAESNGPQALIATGPIHAAGTDVVLSDTLDRFVFPKGNVRVKHTPQASHDSFDPVTCLGSFTETGTYRLVGGSGAYADVSGHGTYRVQAYFVGCSQTEPPSVFTLQIKAHGPISF